MPLLSFIAALVGFLPARDRAVVATPLAWLAGSVVRIRRAQVEAAMKRAGVLYPETSAWQMYRSLAQGVFELFWLAGAKRDLSRVVLVDADSQRQLDGVFARGGGVVIGASHTGNWELTACAMARTHALSVLVKPVSLGVFDHFMKRVRKQYAVGLLSGEGALPEARHELALGRVVAVLVDQVPAREANGDWLDFLGAEALTDRSPAALAASGGYPLVMTASRRVEDGTHRLHVLSVRWPPKRDRTAWAHEATQETTRELGEFVARYPDQWLWLHRRWKRPQL